MWVIWCKNKSFWQRFTCKGVVKELNETQVDLAELETGFEAAIGNQSNMIEAQTIELNHLKQGFTGKPLSEPLISASTNPQYDNRLFIELWIQYMKIAGSEHALLRPPYCADRTRANFCPKQITVEKN